MFILPQISCFGTSNEGYDDSVGMVINIAVTQSLMAYRELCTVVYYKVFSNMRALTYNRYTLHEDGRRKCGVAVLVVWTCLPTDAQPRQLKRRRDKKHTNPNPGQETRCLSDAENCIRHFGTSLEQRTCQASGFLLSGTLQASIRGGFHYPSGDGHACTMSASSPRSKGTMSRTAIVISCTRRPESMSDDNRHTENKV